MFRKIKRFIKKQLGISQIIENQRLIIQTNALLCKNQAELISVAIFNSTIADSKWLAFKSFSPGKWAVDYAFLYTLYRVLNDTKPKNILEFGLGQSSKMIHQFASFYPKTSAITYEHDQTWINFFMKHIEGDYTLNIKLTELLEINYKNEETLSYKNIHDEFHNQKFNLILVDAPFASIRYSRSQILTLLPNCLEQSFCIMIDDCERNGEKETIQELFKIFNDQNVKYCSNLYSGSKVHILVCSEDLKFLTTI